jgi:hypothetical protein
LAIVGRRTRHWRRDAHNSVVVAREADWTAMAFITTFVDKPMHIHERECNSIIILFNSLSSFFLLWFVDDVVINCAW